jgi:prepilin-type N-terminal cleavage/methylation domain-containing protein
MKTNVSVSGVERAGMTLIELLVALTIFGVVITSAIAFAARQNSAFQESLMRLGALRNLRYALTTLEQDLQTLGTNVPAAQPGLLYAGSDVIVFSADYATNVAADPFAVFYDPDVPAGEVNAPSGPLTVPTTAATVADSVFTASGTQSPAEILIFYFEPDSMTARTDDFALYRRVNDGIPDMLARSLLRVGGAPFFSYTRQSVDSAGAFSFQPVAVADLPLPHTAPFHLAAADTGRLAWIDSIRAVRVALSATNGLDGTGERKVDGSRLIPLPNAGAAVLSTCGSAPLLGVVLNAAVGVTPAGGPQVTLSWNPAIDEAGGEGDVVRYVLWKQDLTQPGWGDPYLAIPGGALAYTYEDAAVERGGAYDFALAAQDCTPTLSPRVSSGPVAIP